MGPAPPIQELGQRLTNESMRGARKELSGGVEITGYRPPAKAGKCFLDEAGEKSREELDDHRTQANVPIEAPAASLDPRFKSHSLYFIKTIVFYYALGYNRGSGRGLPRP